MLKRMTETVFINPKNVTAVMWEWHAGADRAMVYFTDGELDAIAMPDGVSLEETVRRLEGLSREMNTLKPAPLKVEN